VSYRVPIVSRDSATDWPAEKIAVADVQVEPRVMDTPYGSIIKRDSRVILRALAISLELGIVVTIKLADAPSRGYRNPQYVKGAIEYIGTHEDGRQEIISVNEIPLVCIPCRPQ
jgi:hypothetical protein